MRKSFLIIFFLLSTVLGGCSASKSSTPVGDFLVDLPGKYSLTDMTSDRCSLMQDDLLLGGIVITDLKQRCTRGYKRYKETSGLIEWKECQIFHSIFT